MPAPGLSQTAWRKSSRSNGAGGACVEIADLGHMVAVRDSKDPDGPKLTFASADWQAFTRDARGGAYDL